MSSLSLFFVLLIIFTAQPAQAGHSNIHSQCDSLIFNPATDVYLLKDCETYYREKLKQIPQKVSKAKRPSKKKTEPYVDSIRKEIEQLVESYEWSDKGVKLQFLADYIFRAPSLEGSIWDDSIITTVYIKGTSGCKKVTLTKDEKGYSGFINSSSDTINDTIHVAKAFFVFREALYITKAISTVLNKNGDTISHFSIDKQDELGTISGFSKMYIEFSGRRVSLRAVCNRKDTLEVECQNYTREKCILCKGISIITGTLNEDFGTSNGTRNSIFSIECDENPCRMTQVPVAIYLINSKLKDKSFFTGSPDKGPRIYTSCEECEKDRGKYFFPGVD